MPGLDNPGYHKISNYFGKFLGIFWKTKILVIDFDFQDFLPNGIWDFDIRVIDTRDIDFGILAVNDLSSICTSKLRSIIIYY